MIDTATRPPSSQFIGRKRGVFPRLACRGWVANTSTIMKKRGGFPRLACPGGVAKTSTNEKTKKNHPLYDKNDDTIAAIPSRQCFSGKIVKQFFSVKSTVISCLIRQKETFWDTFKSKRDCYFFSGIRYRQLKDIPQDVRQDSPKTSKWFIYLIKWLD